jgi:hypothetical protein
MAQRALDNMKVTEGGLNAERYEGTTGPGGLQLPALTSDRKLPTDPTMRTMYQDVATRYAEIQTHYVKGIQDLRKVYDQTSARADLTPEQKRTELNVLTRQITDKWRIVWSRVQDTNAELSRIAGAQVNVNTINWSKGPEQFTRTSP